MVTGAMAEAMEEWEEEQEDTPALPRMQVAATMGPAALVLVGMPLPLPLPLLLGDPTATVHTLAVPTATVTTGSQATDPVTVHLAIEGGQR